MAENTSQMTGSTGTGGRNFPPKGEQQITGFNRIGLWSLYIKEIRRFLKVQTQTIWAPAVTTLLFLVIFTVALGREGVKCWAFPSEPSLRRVSS